MERFTFVGYTIYIEGFMFVGLRFLINGLYCRVPFGFFLTNLSRINLNGWEFSSGPAIRLLLNMDVPTVIGMNNALKRFL